MRRDAGRIACILPIASLHLCRTFPAVASPGFGARRGPERHGYAYGYAVSSELWGQGGKLYPQVQDLYPLYTQVKDAAYVKILSKRL